MFYSCSSCIPTKAKQRFQKAEHFWIWFPVSLKFKQEQSCKSYIVYWCINITVHTFLKKSFEVFCAKHFTDNNISSWYSTWSIKINFHEHSLQCVYCFAIINIQWTPEYNEIVQQMLVWTNCFLKYLKVIYLQEQVSEYSRLTLIFYVRHVQKCREIKHSLYSVTESVAWLSTSFLVKICFFAGSYQTGRSVQSGRFMLLLYFWVLTGRVLRDFDILKILEAVQHPWWTNGRQRVAMTSLKALISVQCFFLPPFT